MATVRRHLSSWLPIVLCVVIGVGVGIGRARSGTATAAETAPVAEVLRVEAVSAYHFDTLDQMVRASEVVVTGEVLATAKGRTIGDPAQGGVISRFVTIGVDRVLRSDEPIEGEQVLIEEEGWLADGTEIMVGDMQPSAPGDQGIWFLDRVFDGDVASYLVINSQGRYLQIDDLLVGGDLKDPLVQQLQSVGFDRLVSETDNVVRGLR